MSMVCNSGFLLLGRLKWSWKRFCGKEEVLWEGRGFVGRKRFYGKEEVLWEGWEAVGWLPQQEWSQRYQRSLYMGKSGGKNKEKVRMTVEICKNIKVLENVNWKQLSTDFSSQEFREHWWNEEMAGSEHKAPKKLLNTKMAIKTYKIHYLQISGGWESTPSKSVWVFEQDTEQDIPLGWPGTFFLTFLSMNL